MDHRPGKFGMRVFTAFMMASCLCHGHHLLVACAPRFAITMLLGYATFGAHAEGVVLNNYVPRRRVSTRGRT